jgi:hypothetical protein
MIAAGYRELHAFLSSLCSSPKAVETRNAIRWLLFFASVSWGTRGGTTNGFEEDPMRWLKHLTSSVCFAIGFAVGTFIITITNALNAGFEAAERKYAKIP